MAFVYWIHLPEHTDITKEGYIGFTSGAVKDRWKQHKSDAKRYPHLTVYKALNKYKDKIKLSTLVEGSVEYCLDIENKLRPRVKIGWNIKIGGDLGSLGVIPSEETRKKMSEARVGEKNHFFGKEHTQESKDKISAKKKGVSVWTEDSKRKMSASRTGRKLNLSQEQRDNRSLRARSRKTSQETKDKLSLSRLGKYTKWKSYKASHMWIKAPEIYDYIMDNPSHGILRLACAFNCTQGQIKNILDTIRKDLWNPREDLSYLDWARSVQQEDKNEAALTT